MSTMTPLFPTPYHQIVQRMQEFDPLRYASTRNYIQGGVSRLSPYIARGVVSTSQILQSLYERGFTTDQLIPFLKELCWRDYFQQVWIALDDQINQDIRYPQQTHRFGVPQALLESGTTIHVLDQQLAVLKDEGYIHNHVRMYVASVACNMAQVHWLEPARWMYYYLLDADWASNALSWQWVAGTFSSKKYYCNQENINRFTGSTQQQSWLDCSYGAFPLKEIPKPLQALQSFQGTTTLPGLQNLVINPSWPTYIYTFYNLDPKWGTAQEANRILLMEPAFYHQYPVSDHVFQFMLELAKNISGIQLYTGSFEQLTAHYNQHDIHFKEHPTNTHFIGTKQSRDFIFPEVTGYFPSFSGYWKRCERFLDTLQERMMSQL